jgi:hypothetical protein
LEGLGRQTRVAIEMRNLDPVEELAAAIEEAKKQDPHKLDGEDLEEEYMNQQKAFADLNSVFIKIAETQKDWSPNPIELQEMKIYLDQMMIVREKASVLRRYEGKTYCGKDSKWCLRRFGTLMDFVVSGATACLLLKDTITDLWNEWGSRINYLEENSTNSFYNTTSATVFETTPSLVSSENSYYLIAMISASIGASKIRDYLHGKAIAFEKRMRLLEDLESCAETFIKEASARYEFWLKCHQLHLQMDKVSRKQYKEFRKLHRKMKAFGGTDDPMYRHGRNLILKRNPDLQKKIVPILTEEKRENLVRVNPCIRYFRCCNFKTDATNITFQDLLDIEKELKAIREGISNVTRSANDLTDNLDARAADYYVIIERLQIYQEDFYRIFSKLNSMPKMDFKSAKEENCGEVVVQTLLEVSSLITITLAEVEKQIGDPSKIMQYVGVSTFLTGFVFSRVRDHLSTSHLNKLQKIKYQKRLLSLEPISRDLSDLIIILSAHQAYKQEQDEIRRKDAFTKALNIAKGAPKNVLGVKVGHIKTNLALTTDAAVLCNKKSPTTKREKLSLQCVRAIRTGVKRRVLRKKAGDKEQLKYARSELAIKTLEEQPHLMEQLDQETKTRSILRQRTVSDLDEIVCCKELEDACFDSPTSKGSSESSEKTSLFSIFKMEQREQIQRQIEELQAENNRSNWMVENKEELSEISGTDSDGSFSIDNLTDSEEEKEDF